MEKATSELRERSDWLVDWLCPAGVGWGWGDGTHSLGGNLSPGPGDGAQHDSEGTGREGGEEAEVQRPLHTVVAHAHHGVQVVLQRSNTEGPRSNGRSQGQTSAA